MQHDVLVSVIIPAHNAAATIDETLTSVRFQSHRRLEIVVVDDGSTDATRDVVGRHQAADARVRLVAQPNAGPGAARNAGVAATTGPLVATVDADDLWTFDKIARQVAALDAAGPGAGLCYTWFAAIDEASRITGFRTRAPAEGDVTRTLCLSNIVGNGSTPLFRRTAFEAAGGYDPALRGSEDFKFYFAVAERFAFALVPDYLTGYRERPGNLTSDPWPNLRDRDRVAAEIAARHPDFAPLLARGRRRLLRFMLARAVRTRDFTTAAALVRETARRNPAGAIGNVAALAARMATRGVRQDGLSVAGAGIGSRFPIGREPD